MHYALARLGVQRDLHITLLVNALPSDLGDAAAELIGIIDLGGEEIELVSKRLSSPDPDTRRRAAKILANVGGSAVLDRLWNALADEDNVDVRKEIRKAIREASPKKKE